jgi:putative addiction module CopG family antidote
MGISEPSLRRFIDEQIAAGRHATADEVVERALRLYRDVQAEQDAHDAMVRREAALGIADIEAGRFEWFENSADLMASIWRDLDERERAEAENGIDRHPHA